MLSACGNGTVITGGGGGGGAGGAGGGTGGAGGGYVDPCSAEAKVVYVVDQNKQLSSFDPKTKSFKDLGSLSCPAQSGAEPFSMAVDRKAVAWVLYDSGELFTVNTTTLACTKTAFDPFAGHGYAQFGMGFSTDQVSGTTDTLYIAGGPTYAASSYLASLNVGTLQPTDVGAVSGWPELTGTGDAKLWGFFPSNGSSTPRVSQLDKSSAQVLKTFQAPSIAGDPNAWAFAFWGGRFWIFLKRQTDTSTSVYEMNAADGGLSTALSNTGRTIVGAGVSTCAPVEIN